MTPDARRAVLRQSVSVAVATGLYGISFGALSVVAGPEHRRRRWP